MASMSPAPEQTMQASSSAVALDAATEHIVAEAEITMSLDAIVTELDTLSTDAARDVVSAAQAILKGNQNDIRNLCNPWRVQLKVQKRYRPMEVIKQELKMALTRRAMMLRSKIEASAGCFATEHAELELGADDTLAETQRSSIQVATDSPATEHASAEFCFEVAMAETLHRIKSICGGIGILAKIVDNACYSEQCVSHRVAEMCREESGRYPQNLATSNHSMHVGTLQRMPCVACVKRRSHKQTAGIA